MYQFMQKTGRPVQFEITPRTRESVAEWIQHAGLSSTAHLFPSRVNRSFHLSTRQYGRIVESWKAGIGLDSTAYGTHSLRRSKQRHKRELRSSHDGRFTLAKQALG